MAYYVHNFSNEKPIHHNGAARVSVYNGDHHVKTYSVPKQGAGRYWYVFDLYSNGLKDVNKIVPSMKRF